MAVKKIGFMLATLMLISILATACASRRPSRVCVVLDTGGETDKSFNEFTLKGAREAAAENELEFAHVVSNSVNDYGRNIDKFVKEACGMIVTVGFLMGDVTAEAARANPDIQFAIVDVGYFPGAGCDASVSDCYTAEGGLTNVTSLLFAEDEVGYLAGTLAACMNESGTIGSVAGMEIPPVIRFVEGYQNGAKAQNPDIETLNVYVPDFNDPTIGKQEAEKQIEAGADIIFGVGGNTGNAALLAAYEADAMAIGVDVDQYYTFPDVASAILTSATKNMDVAVAQAVDAYANDQLEAGILLSTIENGGIGLAPFHDLADQVPDVCQTAVDEAAAGLIDGAISTGYTP